MLMCFNGLIGHLKWPHTILVFCSLSSVQEISNLKLALYPGLGFLLVMEEVFL